MSEQHNKNKLRYWILMLLLLFGTRADGAEENTSFDNGFGQLSLEALLLLPDISIASGNLVPIYKAPAVATVITAAEFKAIGATDLDQVLETVAGLHVARRSASWTRSTPFAASTLNSIRRYW